MKNMKPPHLSRGWISSAIDPALQVHASSVVSTRRGPVVAWFQGTSEGTPDNRIALAHHRDGAWGQPVILPGPDIAHWNPVLSHGPDGRLWLFFKRGAEISAWETWVCHSLDDGDTWSEPQPFVTDGTGGRGPVKNPPLQVGSAWLAPGSVEHWGSKPRWESFIDLSTDAGRTWSKHQIPADYERFSGAGLIQPALWAGSEPGHVHAMMRSSEGVAYQSHSTDSGRTWALAQPSTLPNNNSGLTVVSAPQGALLAVYNPVAGDWALRCPLSLAVSTDQGRTWRRIYDLEDGRDPIDDDPAHRGMIPTSADAPVPADTGVMTAGNGEYSYPSATFDGHDLLVCYTWQRKRIAFARVPWTDIAAFLRAEEKE